MKTLALIIAVVVLSVGWFGLRHAHDSEQSTREASNQEERTWTGAIEPGRTIEIRGVAGDIAVEGGAGEEAEVRAEIRGDARQVEIVARQDEFGVVICTVYTGRVAGQHEGCQPGRLKHGEHVESDEVVNVDFTVSLPSATRVIGRTINGDVLAQATAQRIEAHTVNGDVNISTTGLARASAVNGSIHARMGRGIWEGSLSFTTVNGSVIVELPSELEAEVNLSSVASRIAIEFPVTVVGRFSLRHLRGTIGDGGGVLLVKTVRANVELRRS